MSPIQPIQTAVIILCFTGACAATVWALRDQTLPDFSALEVSAKKQLFFNFLRPYIRDANTHIRIDRARLEAITEHIEFQSPNWKDRRALLGLARDYDVSIETPTDFNAMARELSYRIDIVPEALVLIQAAKESAWGTSRFAVTGNNLFGQQCFTAGCGYVPEEREHGRNHEVVRFDSVEQAVAAYLHNLNTHPRYRAMREIRAELRYTGQAISGTRLADGLLAYSERREAYVAEVKSMIRQNRLE